MKLWASYDIGKLYVTKSDFSSDSVWLQPLFYISFFHMSSLFFHHSFTFPPGTPSKGHGFGEEEDGLFGGAEGW